VFFTSLLPQFLPPGEPGSTPSAGDRGGEFL